MKPRSLLRPEAHEHMAELFVKVTKTWPHGYEVREPELSSLPLCPQSSFLWIPLVAVTQIKFSHKEKNQTQTGAYFLDFKGWPVIIVTLGVNNWKLDLF